MVVLEFLRLFAKSSGELLPKKKKKKIGKKLSHHFSKIQNFSCTIPYLKKSSK